MVYCHLGFNYFYQDDSDLAAEQFQRSIEIDGNFVGGYQNLAGLHYQDSKFELAAEYEEKAFICDQSLVSTLHLQYHR
ncbi:tetratricopeptide repeat protein [Photobacterium leiognathi]|uniref:hypothetical protein n=1 Tax=Photobacterium leiognathi TaxID=553611 RepID=UPI0029823E0B|nr:hypothetical protein [Photobacterium leiognathi]